MLEIVEHLTNINSNRGVKKLYTKVKLVQSDIDKKAKDIMKIDIEKQKPSSIKALWGNIK